MVLSTWMRRLQGLREIKFNDGRVLFHNVPMMVFPVYTVALLSKLMQRVPKGPSALYFMGYQQGLKCAGITRDFFGYKRKVLETLLQHSDMVGTGRVKLVREDFEHKHFIFRFEVSPIAEEIARYYGQQKEAMDHYERGVVAGFIKLVHEGKEEFVAIETRCMAKGDQYCEIVVKEKSAWDRKDPVVKQQWPEEIASLKELGETPTKVFLMLR